MSYVLHIWEHPVPASVAEADEILHLLGDTHGEQNPRFIDLAKRLTKRHPCITTLPEDSPKAVWSDGPLDGKTDRPMYAIGVQTDRLREVLPFVIETAGALGLTVYDPQLGEARLPGGKVLTMPGRRPHDFNQAQAPEPEELTSKGQLIRLVLEDLRPMLEAHGFKLVKRENAYIKKLKEFHYRIMICADYSSRFEIMVDAAATSESELLKRALARPSGIYGFGCELSRCAKFAPVPAPEYPGDKFDVETKSAAHTAAASLGSYLSLAVLPILDKCTSWQDIDRYLNTKPIDQCPLVVGNLAVHLIVALAIGRTDLDTLAKDIRDATDIHKLPNFVAVEKVLAYLKNHPEFLTSSDP